nr:MAG TPA: formylglycinamide ribonucleotide amidotransferase [Caudoviricetes sp.]
MSCGIGILHKVVDLVGLWAVMWGVMWSEKCLFEGEN